MSTLTFPSEQEIEAQEATTTITKWGDLPTGTTYAITETETKVTKYGKSVVAGLETRGGEQYKVWLPKRLGDEVKGLKLPVFVIHKGKRDSSKASCGYYYDYKLYKPGRP